MLKVQQVKTGSNESRMILEETYLGMIYLFHQFHIELVLAFVHHGYNLVGTQVPWSIFWIPPSLNQHHMPISREAGDQSYWAWIQHQNQSQKLTLKGEGCHLPLDLIQYRPTQRCLDAEVVEKHE